jgi:hypothetical protein
LRVARVTCVNSIEPTAHLEAFASIAGCVASLAAAILFADKIGGALCDDFNGPLRLSSSRGLCTLADALSDPCIDIRLQPADSPRTELNAFCELAPFHHGLDRGSAIARAALYFVETQKRGLPVCVSGFAMRGAGIVLTCLAPDSAL